MARRATLIRYAGGIFIGKDELVRLGALNSSADVPEIPSQYSAAFLQRLHPLRSSIIASRVILAFDVGSDRWNCIDRGEGGKSDIVPGSLGPDGRGLSGSKQDRLIANVSVDGRSLKSPWDSYPAHRIISYAVALHLEASKPIEDAPFKDIWGRTADTERAMSDNYRVLLGDSNHSGARANLDYHTDDNKYDVGLLAVWV